MRRIFLLSFPVIVLIFFGLRTVCSQEVKESTQTEVPAQPPVQVNDPCAECHARITPGIVVDWQLSKHSANDVGCSKCHGDRHNSMTPGSQVRRSAQSVMPSRSSSSARGSTLSPGPQ